MKDESYNRQNNSLTLPCSVFRTINSADYAAAADAAAGDAAAGDAVVGTASDDAGDAAGDVVATTASVAFVVTAVASATLKIRAVESPGLLSQGGPPGEKLSLSGKSQLSLV